MSSSAARPEGSDSVRLMAHALDRMLDLLPPSIDRSEETRREAALFIVDQFRLGERDCDRLSNLALAKVTAVVEKPPTGTARHSTQSLA
jgi:hypothetical protein